MANALETANRNLAIQSTQKAMGFGNGAYNNYSFDTNDLAKEDLAKLSGLGKGDGGVFTDSLRYGDWVQKAQATAQANGDKELYTKLGGRVDPNDPWGFYRENAGNQLNSKFLNGNDPSDFYRNKLQALSSGQFGPSDPSYQWRFDQGQQAVERSQAAKGLLNSGNAAIELQQYGQGAASQEYQAEFQRTLQGLSGVESQYNSQFSRLAQMAGINLDPTGSDKIDVAHEGNAVQAQGNQLNYSAKIADINNNQSQWQDQLGMAQQYDKGLGDTLSRLSGSSNSSIYSSYN